MPRQDSSSESVGSSNSTPSSNIFSGDVSSFSSENNVYTSSENGPGSDGFKWSLFFLGLLVIAPIIGFILAFNVVSNDENNNYFNDWTNSLSEPEEVTIDGATYNSWYHEFDFQKDPVPTNSEWIYVEIDFYNSNNWNGCSASENNFYSVSSIDDGILWYDLDCYGDNLENTQGYVSYDGSTFTFAVDTTKSPSSSRVDGEFVNDIDNEISLVIIPILMVIIYIGLLIYSFNSGKKELGYGLLAGLLTGGVTFCLSGLIVSMIFYNDF
ncbi:MAG: hypothetical protein CXT72_06115 [Methanobacteriota archaeon]|nr:MAG: hypothetical protein CXT72_06115 [Euryarchaeota archaeon]HIE63111.1 hypothetical protein [Candidatus Poseidoniales archaeon]HIK99560.1 hypothetical protein [Candidatus Poseidoniales archaeon]